MQIERGGITFVFHRGFVREVRTTSVLWLAHGQTILRQHPVREVDLGGGTMLLFGKVDSRWRIALAQDLATHHDGFRDYDSRAALIEAMPGQLRAWGVGRLQPTGIDWAALVGDFTDVGNDIRRAMGP